MKLVNIINIEGTIVLKTGLHIGAGDTELHIGGTDHPVVRDPFTREPYIPGSSLKGKIRSLLELRSGLIPIQGNGFPIGLNIFKKDLKDDQKVEAIKILKLFGVSASDTTQRDIPAEILEQIGPARASFKDAYLDEKSKQEVKDKQCSYFEIKSENCIDRVFSTANPRFIERVIAGLKFNFSIFLKEMEGDEDLLDYLLLGIKLLELDALGASGSRGYGRVEFKFFDPEISNRFNNINPFTEG